MSRFLLSLKSFLLRSKKSILLIVAVVGLTLILSSAISIWLATYDNLNMPSLGRIKAIGVEAYWDIDLKNKTDDHINWGTVYPGSKVNKTVYLLSISNEDINLTMKKENWSFTYANGSSSNPTNDTQHLDLNWNCEGKELKPGRNITATFTLCLSASRETLEFIVQNEAKSFSFDIRIQPRELSE